MSSLKIHYEDTEVLVIEKPAGIPCLSVKNGKRPALSELISSKYPSAKLVHRLDNDTSGLILAAKTSQAYENLRQQFSSHTKVLKEYIALVIGRPPKSGKITSAIAHHPRKKKKMIVCESEARAKALKARMAVTIFKIINRYRSSSSLNNYALLDIQIKTGVRHQIRAHLASIGFPIAGDKLYQNIKKRKEDILPLDRHFLHASRLGFTHPKTGRWIEIPACHRLAGSGLAGRRSELPQELDEILLNLELIGN